MLDLRYKKLGSVKQKELDNNFDVIYEEYKKIALELGLDSPLKFIKEKGRVIIYVAI
jgi:aromatic ring-opening dioxygenase LigB subunit